MINHRIEKDTMGSFEIPADAYYGANTARAIENFKISDLRLHKNMIKALAYIKYSAAKVNLKLGLLEVEIAEAIMSASLEVVEGRFNNQFIVDIFQTGSGTSSNMNINEVIANLAIEKLGGQLGTKTPVHPNDHVNKGQSSNDVFPSAIHISGVQLVRNKLLPALNKLENELQIKVQQFWEVIKTGRTHLQDATPIRLGQEFSGYQSQIAMAIERISVAATELQWLALGGTAVGTGIGTHENFANLTCQEISKLCNIEFRETKHHFQAQSTIDSVVSLSGALKSCAVSLLKIANDIRWLGSGPRAGIGEIELPSVQPGSSIMPGKVNPVIAESVCMVAAKVIGNDLTVTIAGQSGNFELNVMLPVVSHVLLESIELLSNASNNFAVKCIAGLKATREATEKVEKGLALATALAPIVGYEVAAEIAKESSKTGSTVLETALKMTELNEDTLRKLLNPKSMVEPQK